LTYRRRTLRVTSAVATCGLLLAALLTAPSGTAPAAAAEASFTQTFTQSDGVVIGDPALGGSSPYPSTVAVDFSHVVTDIDITLTGLSYDRAEDLDVVLRTPNGATLDLKRNTPAGTSPIDDVTVVFDTDAATYMWGPVTSGRYLPGGFWSVPEPGLPVADTDLRSLETYGVGATGTWQLFVQGDQAGLVGHLTSWSLTFEGWDPPPSPPPTITGPADGTRTTSHTVTVTGTAEPGLWVQVIADGGLGAFANVVAGADRSWTAVLSNLMGGAHTVRASTSDGGLRRSTTVSIQVVVDNAGPALTVAIRPLVGSVMGTSRRTVTLLVGSNEPVAQMRISNDVGTLGAPQPFAAVNTWTLSDRDGEHRVYVQLEDPLGNVSRGFDTVVLERVAPRVTRTWPAARSSRVRRGHAVRAQFTKPVTTGGARLTSLAKVFRVGSSRPIPATVTYHPSLAIVRVEPLHPLRPGTRYRVVMTTGFRDPAGNRVDQDPAKAGRQPATWRFTTR
jgi:subtilisin-like proprotein convertase family protein